MQASRFEGLPTVRLRLNGSGPRAYVQGCKDILACRSADEPFRVGSWVLSDIGGGDEHEEGRAVGFEQSIIVSLGCDAILPGPQIPILSSRSL